MLARRVFLFIFVLLQGISPLLHAHAGMAGHEGFHMPGGPPTDLHQGKACHFQADDEGLAVTVAASLEARNELLLPGGPAPACLLPLPPRITAAGGVPRWVPFLAPPVETPLSRHLIPHPCAPPRA